jgi:hypothetical protein
METNKPSITLAAIEERLGKLQVENGKEQPPAAPSLPLGSPLVQAAAVLGLFKPERITPVLNGNERPVRDPKAIFELISHCDPVQVKPRNDPAAPGNILYCLRPALRVAVLNMLIAEERLQKVLNANRSLVFDSREPLQQMLTGCLAGTLPPLATLQAEQLRGLRQVCEWLAEVKPLQLPDPLDVDRRLGLVEMLASFKHLVGRYDNGRFEEFFRGRHHELAILRQYVGVASPQGVYENIRHKFEAVTSLRKKPPLLITGLGGIGKSTLIAKFILSHAEAHEEKRFPFVYIDFDRPHISVQELETLLVEAARQLAIQYADVPAFSSAATKFCTSWSRANVLLEDTNYSEAVRVKSYVKTNNLQENWDAMQSAFINLFNELPLVNERKPFLIVLDTFEEVQYKGEAYVKRLYQFMNQLQAQYPLLRTVVAGRAPVTQFKTHLLKLGDLDHEAAQSFLENVCKTGPATARTIVSKVGGNPLTLKLAAEFVNVHGVKALAQTSLSEQRYLLFEKSLPEIRRQGILYKRILGHIHNTQVKKLANPGLVLRRITPGLIKEVLNIPCGLGLHTDEQARELFEETAREVSLVTRIDEDTLRHRADVRKIMLLLMQEEHPEKVKLIHRLALSYYREQQGLAAKAEECYHRLCLDQSAAELDEHWTEGMQQFLSGSLDELPPRAQTYLVARTGVGHLEADVWAQAEDVVRERWAIRRAGDLLNAGLTTDALQVIRETLPVLSSDRGILRVMLVRVLVELGQRSEAVNVIFSILKGAIPAEILQYKDELISLLSSLRTGIKKNVTPPETTKHIKGTGIEEKKKKDDDDDLPSSQSFDMVFSL